MAFQIELVIIAIAILYQFFHSIRLLGEIYTLKEIFEDRIKVRSGLIERSNLSLKDNIFKHISFDDKSNQGIEASDIGEIEKVRISITETTGSNEVIERITKAINNYLLNNYGAAVNFSIIKDIIDREVDVADEEISQSIPTPLYLGLAATMVGIIFGLLAFGKTGSGEQFDIKPLINGVKVAMSASLVGLAWTTLLSSFFYKQAKKKVLRDKNDQLNYLLKELLPELIKAEDTGVSGLKASLDLFAREAKSIADNVNLAAKQTSQNLMVQLQTIDKISRMDMTKVSKTNLELFERLEKNMSAFNKFSEFLAVMQDISVNLKDFAERTIDINNVARSIRMTLSDSNELTHFLTDHFKKLETAGSNVLKTVDLTDSHFCEALELLKGEIDNRIANLNSTADNHHSQLREIYHEIGQGLNNITTRHLNEFQSAYSNAVPQFRQLDQLENLLPIKETLASKADLLVSNASLSNDIIIDILKDLRSGIVQINTHNSSVEKLYVSINEFSKKITDLNRSGNTNPSKKKWLKISEFILKISVSLMILIVGGLIIYFILFKK